VAPADGRHLVVGLDRCVGGAVLTVLRGVVALFLRLGLGVVAEQPHEAGEDSSFGGWLVAHGAAPCNGKVV
jgi:hypothetical protein